MQNIREKLKRRLSHKDESGKYKSLFFILSTITTMRSVVPLVCDRRRCASMCSLCSRLRVARPRSQRLELTSSANFDEHDSADEETVDYVNTEAEEAEREKQDMGKPGSFLNRLIVSAVCRPGSAAEG